jgi:hypothetical protein
MDSLVMLSMTASSPCNQETASSCTKDEKRKKTQIRQDSAAGAAFEPKGPVDGRKSL